MDGYLNELEGMEPPRELQPYRDKLMDFFHSIDEAAAAVDQAVKPEDLSSFAQFRQWFATALEDSQALWSEATSFLSGLGGSIDTYIEQGKELAARIQAL
jgi:nitrate reductase assembly molybdenum cofactor insertion protein NarJ